jgi:hypothetical protein
MSRTWHRVACTATTLGSAAFVGGLMFGSALIASLGFVMAVGSIGFALA